jgi:hypothetical protein
LFSLKIGDCLALINLNFIFSILRMVSFCNFMFWVQEIKLMFWIQKKEKEKNSCSFRRTVGLSCF